MSRKSYFTLIFILLILLGQTCGAAVKNVIVMIGDGMGFEQVKAASLYAYGEEGKLSFEQYYRGEVMTHSADSYKKQNHATDSAAAGTAFATGQKVKNGVICQESNKPIETILEILKEKGKATGLITTVPLTHATPAAYGAHSRSRNNYSDIAKDYMTDSRPNVLFGAYYKNGRGLTQEKAKKAGYTIAMTRKQMLDMVDPIDKNSEEEFFLVGLFSPDGMPWEYDYYHPKQILFPLEEESTPTYDTIPHLSEMTSAALTVLDNDSDGFFLMVEGGTIDWAGHSNNIENNVFETLEFDRAFKRVMDWAIDRDDTLVIVTADHECGGLWVVKNNGRGTIPDVFWGLTNHSGVNVPVYAVGQGAKEFVGVIDNTDIFKIIKKLTEE